MESPIILSKNYVKKWGITKISYHKVAQSVSGRMSKHASPEDYYRNKIFANITRINEYYKAAFVDTYKTSRFSTFSLRPVII